ncbi:DUF481 domain-containing protein [Myxococcota bacterium]|nr:DUF481 domain-containing protein [Myxococcota bacterium]
MSRARPLLAHWLVTTAAVTWPSTALANPVNAEVLRPNPFREGWSGGVDGSLALSRGNVELLDLGGAARVQYQTLHALPPGDDAGPARVPFVDQRVFLAVSARFAERAGTAFLNQGFAHLRWTSMWHARVGSDVFAQYQFNEFQRLGVRAIAGLGARFELVHAPVFMAWAGTGYMFEHDRIDVLAGAPDDPESFEHRWTSYLTARLALFDARLLLQNTLYHQPRLDALDDVRVLEELEVLAKVSDAFALGVTTSLMHDSAPPTGVKGTDLRLFSTVRWSF